MTALAGLALALVPGSLAARRPIYLLGLALDGTAVMFILYFCSMLPRAGRWWVSGSQGRAGIIVGGIVVGVVGLLIMMALRAGLRQQIPNTLTEIVAGLDVLLVLPLVHHLYVGFIEGYFYLSDAANFFAPTLWYQIFALLLTILIVWLTLQLSRYLIGSAGAETL